MINRWDLSLYWPRHYLKCFNTHASVNAKNNRIPSNPFSFTLFPFLPLFPSQVPLYRGSVAHWIPIRIPWTSDFCKQCLGSQTPAWMLSSTPHLLFFILNTNVKATFRGSSNQGHVHKAGQTSRGLRLGLALSREVWKRIQRKLFALDYSHIHINMILNRKGWRSNSTTILCASAPFSV